MTERTWPKRAGTVDVMKQKLITLLLALGLLAGLLPVDVLAAGQQQ